MLQSFQSLAVQNVLVQMQILLDTTYVSGNFEVQMQTRTSSELHHSE